MPEITEDPNNEINVEEERKRFLINTGMTPEEWLEICHEGKFKRTSESEGIKFWALLIVG